MFALVLAILVTCIQQYVNSAPQYFTSSGSDTGLQTVNEFDINLKEYPNHATTINLRNTIQFPCILSPGSNCSVVLQPPENHGILVIVQKLDIRLNANARPQQCRDSLLVDGSSGSSAKICGRFDRKQSAGPADSFIGASTQYLFRVNENVRLTLFHDRDGPDDDLYEDKWELNGEIGGLLSVTSYFDCSNLTSWQRLGYRNCSPSASGGGRCISSSLFCDGQINCAYDGTNQSDGYDELNCPTATSRDKTPSSLPSSWELLLPVRVTTTSPSSTTSRRSVRIKPSTTSTSPDNDPDPDPPVYTYNDIRRTRTKTYTDGSNNYLSLAFVFILFSTVVLLTLCFGCLKLPGVHSRNYETNEPLDNARNGPLGRAHSNASIDTIGRIFAAVAPPPEYREASGLPSYDSLFQKESTTPINGGGNNSPNYNAIIIRDTASSANDPIIANNDIVR